MFLNFGYLLFIAPAILLAMVAQWMVSSAFRSMSQVRARMSGFEAARRVLDANGLQRVEIEQVAGHLSDHYDPSSKVLRLSSEVFHGASMSAVGIAAHEAGHAIQDGRRYPALVIRNIAVPAANLGSSLGGLLLMIGIGMLFAGIPLGKGVAWIGVLFFAATVLFQLVNLVVEFDASSRAKTELVRLGIISGPELPYVSKVLTAAALTYVAATLQAVLTLAYYASMLMRSDDRNS